MRTVGVILSTMGVFSTVGDIMSTVGWSVPVPWGGQYRGDTILCKVSTMGDFMIHVEDIMRTMGVFGVLR